MEINIRNLEVSINENIKLKAVFQRGERFYVKDRTIILRSVGPSLEYTLKFANVLPPAVVLRKVVLSSAKKVDLARMNGFIAWNMNRLDVREVMMSINDYVLKGIVYTGAIQFCNWCYDVNSKDL